MPAGALSEKQQYWLSLGSEGVAGTRTAHYRAVLPKIDRRRVISAVGGRLKGEVDRRWSIGGEIDRRQSIEREKGKKKKRKQKK
ncbi:hypothetical protein B296_00051268 [Ensete ventricosum]|uniref:Uncharacterized protein n=1 Tax=Ensete ventricosum TaxID=4639 RepID=A0A426YHB9_ENSVE|nr:hypothetical protein B296_00051268 [Ensete ventricosum]